MYTALLDPALHSLSAIVHEGANTVGLHVRQ